MRFSPLKRSTITIAGGQDTEVALPPPAFANDVAVMLEEPNGQDTDAAAIVINDSFFWVFLNLLERIAAGVMLALLFPLLLAIGVLVSLLSRRSPFVAHLRVGRKGSELWVLKFRTMWNDGNPWVRSHILVEHLHGGSEMQLKNADDPRVTSRFAALCRRYSIDELPQLWHVVQGDMALIGPRPLTAQEIVTFYGSDASRLLLVRPGLSGLWQVSGRSKLTLEERRRLDLFMLENWSLRLYLRILQATVPCVLSGRDAW